jgi:two-component system chemotaxis response regulator CheB
MHVGPRSTPEVLPTPTPAPAPAPLTPAQAVVVVAASAGGVQALTRLAAGLSADMRAAILVVLHIPPRAESRLPEILSRVGPLQASRAVDGESLLPGTFAIAVPDRHLLISDGRMRVVDGPRENRVRPAADPLFRSAAREYGDGTIGVVLSGTLDDGAAGLAEIHAAGGMTLVQDPLDALADGMPLAAIENVAVDHVATADRIGALLPQLAERIATREGGGVPTGATLAWRPPSRAGPSGP